MKNRKRQRRIVLFLAMLLAAVMAMCLLSACSREEKSTVQTVTRNGRVYTIDQASGTISDETNVYHFQVNGNHFEFVYPDGSKFYWTQEKNGGYGGWSDDYNGETYVDGYTLFNILNAKTSEKSSSKPIGLGIVLFLCGLFNAVAPEAAWYLSDGWKFKNSEPSDLALGLTRFTGSAAMVIGVIILVF